MLYKLKDLVIADGGLQRGPFGGDLKKDIFVSKSETSYKVYEQGIVLNKNIDIGNYYITNDYFKRKMYRFAVLPGDILVSCSGVNYGAIYLLPDNCEKGIINQALLRIRLNSSIIDKYYFCYLWERTLRQKITQSSADSTIPNFPPLSTIKELTIDIPILSEQKRIVDLPLCIDKLVENNNKKIRVLTNKIKDIFCYWFSSNYAKDTYNYGQCFNSESITNNPLCSLLSAGIQKFEGYKDYFSTSEVNGINYASGNNFITFENRKSRANMQPIPFSVWFAKMKNSIKHISFSKDSYLEKKIILSTGFAGLKCSEISYPYVWSIVNTQNWFEEQKDYLATGSTQKAVNENSLSYIKIEIPNKACLIEYAKYTKPLLNLIDKIAETNDSLIKYKSVLLSKIK